MTRLSLWHSGIKGNDYKFFDRTIAEFFGVGGTGVLVHKYLGPYTADSNGDPTLPSGTTAPTTIQDLLFLENRDRAYDRNVYELRGIYNVLDAEFDLRQFGLFLENDTLFISFHVNDMVARLGRKLMAGDVIELPHRRDYYLLNPDNPAINKFYIVDDANFSSEGYSPTWWPHVWRVKCKPMTASQETQDILNLPATNQFGQDTGNGGVGSDEGFTNGLGLGNTGTTLGDIMSTLGQNMDIDDAVVAAAKLSVPARNFQTQQFYIVPPAETAGEYPWIFAGDGVPPNGATLVGSGSDFPDSPTDGDYFLRTDYEPRTLFQYQASDKLWRYQELDYRKGDWSMAHRLLMSFIENTNTATYDDGTVNPEKQPLSKAVTVKADL